MITGAPGLPALGVLPSRRDPMDKRPRRDRGVRKHTRTHTRTGASEGGVACPHPVGLGIRKRQPYNDFRRSTSAHLRRPRVCIDALRRLRSPVVA